MKALLLREAYRSIPVKEDGRTVAMPAMRAILRSQVGLAAKGNVQAQRAVIESVEAVEHANMEAARIVAAQKPQYTYAEAARRISLLLRLGKQEEEEEKRKQEEQEKGRSQEAAAPPQPAGSKPERQGGPREAVAPIAPVAPPPAAPWREPPPRPSSYARHPIRDQR